MCTIFSLRSLDFSKVANFSKKGLSTEVLYILLYSFGALFLAYIERVSLAAKGGEIFSAEV